MKVRRHYRIRIFGLIIVLIMVAVAVMMFTLFSLFRSVAYQNQYALSLFVENQTILFQNMLNDERLTEADRARAIANTYARFSAQSETIAEASGTFQVIAKVGESVHWHLPDQDLIVTRYAELEDEVVFAALAGSRGLVVLEDQMTSPVVKAFSGLEDDNIAFVLTIPLAEIREPFVMAAIKSALAAILLVSMGGFVFYRLSRPIIVHLEENEAKYRTLFDNANEGVLLLGSDVIECNDRAAMMLDTKRRWLLGRDINSFNSSETIDAEVRAIYERAWSGAPQYFFWTARSARGRNRELEVMIRKIQLDEQAVLLVTLVDITDRKRYEKDLREAEQAIRDSRDHLAHVARLNTMGEMAAGIAHEINQPLSAITTYAQASKKLLSNEELDVEMLEEAMSQIAAQSLRAGEVIRRLREFVNKSNTRFSLMEPDELVKESVALGNVDARKYDIPVRVQCEPTDQKVRVDAVQIQQVLINLIRNALEAVSSERETGGEVSVVLDTFEEKVRIRVIDNGPGLSEEALARVFHPFFTTKQSGMGIGLSISYSIMQSHKGQLSAYNRDEGGAVFEMLLPVATPINSDNDTEETE